MAIGEIRAARRELRTAQAEADRLELASVAARQTAQQREQEHQASVTMLAARVSPVKFM